MKRIAIGRGRECDIRINDSSDKISRKQCVITKTFTGKMRIYDTSANGTFLNGERVPVPDGCPVRKGDHINFAHTTDFDWSTWKDPYRGVKVMLVTLLGAAIVIAVLFIIFAAEISQKAAPKEQPKIPVQEVVADDTVASAKIVSPLTEPITPVPAHNANTRRSTKKNSVKEQVSEPENQPLDEQSVVRDSRLSDGGASDISDEELNRRRKMN